MEAMNIITAHLPTLIDPDDGDGLLSGSMVYKRAYPAHKQGTSVGVLAGHIVQPRQLVELSHDAGWADLNLLVAVSVWLSESQGYTEARNDNLDSNGTVISRDCGICQINIPASAIGTTRETDLYDPEYCIGIARKLFEDRGFQPWVAHESGVYLHAYYQARAALGIFNYHCEQSKIHVPVFTLAELRAKNLW